MAPEASNKFGAPMFEPELFRKQMYSIEKSICDIVGTFRRPPQPPQWFDAPIVIRRPGNCAPLVTPLYAFIGDKFRPVTSLGHQGCKKFSERVPNFYNYVQQF